ncbi:MAG: hypothetical protein A3C90_00530 [Candidatus Magasanikbacteria bacterium RIFCSPHIGHO2_02_FULL_51_14]|uniref:Methyltransferase type 11 domain-containing protein n=1 Tax=Candidatus Magasanikbacteria bacterium RIFCSPHIGHO2_02_FULL_51_14 TaxID=1798683 RepID=A0A1F6MHG8_9BACT|nr:MAG: hypothetical protein A3C90_00530 [Candidatus Magasanikbacteria bacterium RIFCSPHIGHO2_02_FULL_51_14]
MSQPHITPWNYLAERMTDDAYTPPGRPSPQDLIGYRRFLCAAVADTERPSALILGATPDLRDLLYEEGVACTVLDCNPDMIEQMTAIRQHCDPNETVVVSDWINNTLPSESFDVILGDFVISNIPWDKQQDFFLSVARLLKRNGRFITRMSSLTDDWRDFDVMQVLEKYQRLPEHPWRPMELFCEIFWNTHNPDTHSSGGPHVVAALHPFGRTGEWRHPDKKIELLFARMWEFWKPMDKVWTLETLSELRRRFETYFCIEDEHRSRDHQMSAHAPTWMGRPRSRFI